MTDPGLRVCVWFWVGGAERVIPTGGVDPFKSIRFKIYEKPDEIKLNLGHREGTPWIRY